MGGEWLGVVGCRGGCGSGGRGGGGELHCVAAQGAERQCER